MIYIASYCRILNNRCHINGEEKSFKHGTNDFLKTVYQSLSINYPKFHKMDKLSKTGFIGVELLIKTLPEISLFKDNEVAMIFSNKNSSAVTDQEFLESYNSGNAPSPSLFVYTLPNILIGEIAIRNGWYGENMFAISPQFDPSFFENNCKILLNKNSTSAICGWVNVTKNEIDAFLFFVSTKDLKNLNLPLDSSQLKNLYNNVK